MQIVIELIQRPKINVSVTPKILVCILFLPIFFKAEKEHFLGSI